VSKPDMNVFGRTLAKRTPGQKSWWKKVGVAFENTDGSISVKLDFMPNDGELVLWAADQRGSPEEEPA
jgi:hypothetical protein